METMRTFHAGRFTVTAAIETDYDVDLSWDETGETADKLNSGEWFAFLTKVSDELRTEARQGRSLVARWAFDTAVEAAAYAEEYMPLDGGWSRVSITYKSTSR